MRWTVLLLVLAAASVAAQPVSTRCDAVGVPIDGLTTDLRLLGCGDEYTTNTLWHLDRADSLSGALDGTVLRPATGKGVVVYVFDSGIRADHDEFARPGGTNVIGALDPGRELGFAPETCASGFAAPLDPCRDTATPASHWVFTHGTATASIIAGRTTGVAPDASLVAVHVARFDAFLYLEGLDSIIRHAWDSATPPFRTAIVNMSLLPAVHGDPYADGLEAKMRDMIYGVDSEGRRDANGKRFLFVSIAGNYHAQRQQDPPRLYGQCDAQRRVAMFPATRGTAIDGLIVAGGITPENRVWEGSCIGDGVDILAPASDMFVATLTGRDHYRSAHRVYGQLPNAGTSYAAPYVSGLAALLLEKSPELSPEDLERIIKSGASRVADPNETTAGGRVAIFDRQTVTRGTTVQRGGAENAEGRRDR
ncbi:MAG TPA: S8 family serine peptidase [Thermoanaerobaculia bacterium]|nr:S8 family serine peptidase [Thermoanaerobaculia bacterium]